MIRDVEMLFLTSKGCAWGESRQVILLVFHQNWANQKAAIIWSKRKMSKEATAMGEMIFLIFSTQIWPVHTSQLQSKLKEWPIMMFQIGMLQCCYPMKEVCTKSARCRIQKTQTQDILAFIHEKCFLLMKALPFVTPNGICVSNYIAAKTHKLGEIC